MPWFTQGLKNSGRKRDKLFNKKLRNPTENNINTYKTYNNIYNKVKRAAKINYYRNLFTQHKNNIKMTWSILNQLTGRNKQRDNLPNTFSHQGRHFPGNKEIANGLNNFFAGVGPNLANKITPTNKIPRNT